MIDYTYKAKFEFDLGSGSADGEVRARGVSDAVLLVESELCESYSISKKDIKTMIIEAS